VLSCELAVVSCGLLADKLLYSVPDFDRNDRFMLTVSKELVFLAVASFLAPLLDLPPSDLPDVSWIVYNRANRTDGERVALLGLESFLVQLVCNGFKPFALCVEVENSVDENLFNLVYDQFPIYIVIAENCSTD
jgi:hypothetical protein